MASVYFQNRIPMILAATPSNDGFLLAYDEDGILKQKDNEGNITLVGGTNLLDNDQNKITPEWPAGELDQNKCYCLKYCYIESNWVLKWEPCD